VRPEIAMKFGGIEPLITLKTTEDTDWIKVDDERNLR